MKRILAFCIILAVLFPAAVSASTTDYSTVAYKELARHPDAHTGDLVQVTGEVNQVIGDDEEGYTVRLLTGRAEYGDYYVGDDIFVYFPALSERILEDDIITVYGESAGLYTYETILGAERTIPLLRGHSFVLVG